MAIYGFIGGDMFISILSKKDKIEIGVLYIITKNKPTMKFLNSPIEYILFLLFVIYVVFPLETPVGIAKIVNSPLGMILLFLLEIAFLYFNPLLAGLFLFVVYELVRRSMQVLKTKEKWSDNIPNVQNMEKPVLRTSTTTPTEKTLEEQIVEKMSPIGGGSSKETEYVNTSFRPISTDIHSASLV